MYYDFTQRDFFSVCNCILEREKKRKRRARARKVRRLAMRRFWRGLRRHALAIVAFGVWSAVWAVAIMG